MSWMSNRLGSAGALAALLLACGNPRAKEPEKMALDKSQQAPSPPDDARAGRLRARPGTPTVEPSAARGVQKLGLGGRRDGLLYVPESYRADRPAPLVVMLHGAGGNADHALDPLLKLADEAGLLLLAPDSRGPTWDVIMDDYGPDVAFIDGALAHVFARYAVDPERIAVEGFSDGASYALSLGVGNGDLFRHVIAFSPGFLAPPRQEGEPRLFISHGTQDTVLPIGPCSRTVVPRMERAGYQVRYREFEGGHHVPPRIAREALDWFTAKAE
jgi:predicted esterase